jgi:ADP-ribose pyrophosphatase YjhB (NUDIX family)
MENTQKGPGEKTFYPIVLGLIYDPKERKILIGKRENDPFVPELTWVFPGGKIDSEKDLECSLKEKIKTQTGFDVENLGNIFARIFSEKKDFITLYYMCEIISGEEKVGGNLKELKWVSPEDLENYFTTSFHPHLKEYILNLK